MQTHEFEFDGQPVTYRNGTNRDAIARRIICQKLVLLLGGADISALDNDAAYLYADFLSHCTPFKAPWYRRPEDTPQALLEGYQLYMDADEKSYEVFIAARDAVKKTQG